MRTLAVLAMLLLLCVAVAARPPDPDPSGLPPRPPGPGPGGSTAPGIGVGGELLPDPFAALASPPIKFRTAAPGTPAPATKGTKGASKAPPPVATVPGYALHKGKDGAFIIKSATRTVKLPAGLSEMQAKFALGFYSRGMLEVKDGKVKIPAGQVYDGKVTQGDVTVQLNPDGTIQSWTDGKTAMTFTHKYSEITGTQFADVTVDGKTYTVSDGKVQSSKEDIFVGADGRVYQFSDFPDLGILPGGSDAFSPITDHGLSKEEIAALKNAAKTVSAAGETEGRLVGPKQPSGLTNILGTINDFLTDKYPGITELGGLLLGDALADWKAQVDEAFCNTIILGGKSCWVSKICNTSPENAGGDGVLIGQTLDNQTLTIRFIAHIEGTRSMAAEFLNQTDGGSIPTNLFLYKTTYAIRNPNRREPNGYNVRFFYPGGSYDWFPDFQSLEQAEVETAIGNNALVAYSTRLYTRVCLVFENTVEVNGQGTRQVCNRIVQRRGAPTTPFPTPRELAEEQAQRYGAGEGF